MGKGNKRSFQARVGGKEVLNIKVPKRNPDLVKAKIDAKNQRSKDRNTTVREFIQQRGETQRFRSQERSKGTKYRAAGLAAGSVGNNAVDSAYALAKGGVNDDRNDDNNNNSGGSGMSNYGYGGGIS